MRLSPMEKQLLAKRILSVEAIRFSEADVVRLQRLLAPEPAAFFRL